MSSMKGFCTLHLFSKVIMLMHPAIHTTLTKGLQVLDALLQPARADAATLIVLSKVCARQDSALIEHECHHKQHLLGLDGRAAESRNPITA